MISPSGPWATTFDTAGMGLARFWRSRIAGLPRARSAGQSPTRRAAAALAVCAALMLAAPTLSLSRAPAQPPELDSQPDHQPAAAEPAAPSPPMAGKVGPSLASSTGEEGPALAAAAGGIAVATGKGPVIERCPIKLKTEVDVPAIESGMLMSLEAPEGMEVRGGMTLGHIDDREPKVEKKINRIKHDSAKTQAGSDIDVRASKLAHEAAEFTFERNQEAAAKVRNAVPATELKKYELEKDKTRLAIDKAILERQRLAYEAAAKGAEVEAADLSIQRRKILAPFDGVVTNIYCHPGEWVSAGDRVLKVVRIDLLRVEGTLKATEYDPHEIDGRPVTIEAELAHGRRVTASGKVVFVSPLVSVGGSYDVLAEVSNWQQDGQWVLRPGLEATMTIDLK